MDKIKHLTVSSPQGICGDLRKESRFVFNYTAGERSREVSLTMPIRAESYSSGALLPVFEMNKPEGYLLSKIEEAFAKIGRLDDMALLALTGGTQIGRLNYALPGAQEHRRRAQIGRRELLARRPTAQLFDELVAIYFESGISGVQPKVLLPDADSVRLDSRATVVHADLIVKASGSEFPHLTENEFLCMSAARRAGLAVPDFDLSEDGGLFVCKRFDLGLRQPLGFEDMAVLMGKPSRGKYEGSYEGIARAIRLFCADADPLAQLRRFFEYVTCLVMMRNGDGHLKNFGLLYEHPDLPATVRLAPLFDVVTTSICDSSAGTRRIAKYDRTLALNLAKSRQYPDRRTLLRFAGEVCEVRDPQAVIERIGDAMSETLDAERGRIHSELLAALRKEWDAGRESLQPVRVFGPDVT